MPRGPWHDEADLIVVGASVGGLAAAIVAADRRCRIILLERAKELGGGAASDGEALAAAGSRFQQAAGVVDDAARLSADIQAAMRQPLEPELTAALAAQGAPLVAWLADRCGAKVELLGAYTAPGHSAARLHTLGERGGASLIADLTRAATHHSRITVRTGAMVERLVRDDGGTVRGVAMRADRRGASQTLAGRVLLACGGFAADDTLVAQHCPAVAELPYGGPPGPTGEGLRLGLEAGGHPRHLSGCRVTPFLAMPGELVVSAPLIALGGILVNQAGRRFASESEDGRTLALGVRAQPGKVAYLVFDERIAVAARAADPFFGHVVLPRTGRRAATLELLAKQFELNAEGLRRTVEAFNAGGPDAFGRQRGGEPLVEPLHAIRVTGARTRTHGGLAVDTAARVLDSEGRPIAGLYATASAAIGLAGDGTGPPLAGVDALASLGLARLAALDVVAQTTAAEAESESA